MRAIRLAFLTFFLLAMHATKSNAATAKSKPPARDQHLPPSEQTAKDALNHSPRHGEYVDVTVLSGGAIRTWVSYPERSDKAGVVLVIHEIFGLSDWVRGVADALARDGFIAIVPDLILGLGSGGGGTDSVASRDDVVKLVIALKPEDVKSRLDVIRDYALSLPPANGKLATVGFCWGGRAELPLRGDERRADPGRGGLLRHVAGQRDAGPGAGAGARALRQGRRPRHLHHRARARGAEEAGQELRAARVRRGGPWVPARPGGPQRSQSRGHAQGLAAHDCVPEEAPEVGWRK